MELKPLKKELKDWIETVDDEGLLSLIHSIKSNATETKDWWLELDETQKNNIQKGLDDLKANRLMSSQDFWASLAK